MEGTGIIGAIALIIIFMFVCMLVFIIKLILDVRLYKSKQKNDLDKPSLQKEEKVMYLIEKPKVRSKQEKEYTMVSPKKIYTIDEKK